MNSAEKPFVNPKTPEIKSVNNKLRELLRDEVLSDGTVVEGGHRLYERRVESINATGLTQELKDKRIKEVYLYFHLMRQLRERLDDEWRLLHKEMLAALQSTQMPPEFIASRDRYIDSSEPKKLIDLLDEWIRGFEEAATVENDESEKQNLFDLVDAATKLQADIANW